MGPDCGTALINGFPLGFCNRVPQGPVGIVAASGTGAQELMSLLAARNVGISHVLGTGGRDLTEEIGGLTFEVAMKALGQDVNTQVIILVSKPPDPAVETRILSLAQDLGKPVVVSFVGQNRGALSGGNLHYSESMAHAASIAVALIKNEPLPDPISVESVITEYRNVLVSARAATLPTQRFIRGLYSGGTLADETAIVLARYLPEVYAGHGFGKVLPIQDWDVSRGNMVLDLGDERFTVGRPHPMIDSGIRAERILSEGRDPSVSVLILDIILGLNADENPSKRLAPAIQEARQAAASDGRSLSVFVHICGTELDPQNLAEQKQGFENAGSLVFHSNIAAALAAVWMVRGEGEETSSEFRVIE
jgi:FdrA protein